MKALIFKCASLALLLFGFLQTSKAQPCTFNGGHDPCNAIALTVNATCSFSLARTNGCGNFLNSGTCTSGTRPDVWGVFTTAVPMNLTVRHNSTNRNMTVHVYTLAGSCAVPGNFTQVACSNANGGTGNEDVVLAALPAGTYYVRAEAIGQNGLQGSGFCVFGSAVAGGADGAWPGSDLGTLSCPATTSVSDNTTGANVDCGVSSAGDHIYQFTLAQNMDITLDVCGASWDTQLHLFNLANGNCNAGSIATNDDACGLQSSITQTCLAAGTYVIVVEGFGGNEGAYTLNLTTSNCACVIPPPGPQDCAGGTTVCNDQSFSGNSSGVGTTQELNGTNSGCLSIEHQSSWYFFEANTAGTLEFTISPQNGTDDYDFAVWGPYPTGSTPVGICPPTVAPLRCSYAAGGGNTGLDQNETDNTEGAGGNRFVDSIQANAGDVYILVIDNFSTSSQPFDLSWSLTNGASLDCTVLPVVLSYFEGESVSNGNRLSWQTLTEINNKHFKVERSENGVDFYPIGTVRGKGNSQSAQNYVFTDFMVDKGYYYRLKQVDFDGKFEYSNVIFIGFEAKDEVAFYPNPTTGTLNMSFNGSTETTYTIVISNMIGSVITSTVNVSPTSSVQLDVFNELAKGIYSIKVIDNENNIIKIDKVVKK